MPNYHFFAMLSRMKYIHRWGLMRNTHPENLSEHSLDVAVIAYALAVLRNRRFGGDVDPRALCAAALFHDTAEIITGDLPTPIKYHSRAISSAYRDIESGARLHLLSLLPDDMAADFAAAMAPDDLGEYGKKLVKAADKISALTKCVEEQRAGNHEFDSAAASLRRIIADMALPEADCFLEEFLPSYSLTLDEMR